MIPRWLRDYVAARIAAATARVRSIAKSGRPVELVGHATGAGDDPYQDQALMLQHYGFSSRPRPGSEVVALAVAGYSSQLVAVASETPGQGPTDQVDGEVELYSQHGQRVQLQADGGVRIQAASGAVAWLKADGSVQVSSGNGGGVATLSGARWTVQDEAAAQRYYVTGTPPIAAGVPGVTATVTAGADGCFSLTLIAAAITAGTVATITYTAPWSSPPLVSISGGGPLPLVAAATTTQITVSCAALPVGAYVLVVTSTGID